MNGRHYSKALLRTRAGRRIQIMTAQDQRNIEIARRLYTGEYAERSNIAQDIVWHVPGHNPVSGDYHGFKEYTELMPSRMAPLTRWSFEVHDVMVNGSYVVATVDLKGERKGKTVNLHGAHILRINDDGWSFTSD
jgi:ketosteroid isomerase-like protein